MSKPSVVPSSANFGSGPCKKRPGYNVAEALADAPLGRSHRSTLGKNKLKQAIDDTKRILGIPEDYLCGIVPASDTGAVEMIMWSICGTRPVDICFWENFGKGWFDDATGQLSLENVSKHSAEYGHLPDLSKTDPTHDIIFTWNGTTSGVRVPNADWISDDREGLTICDATSAVFAMEMPWKKLDVTTFSWQKVMGGEAAHGMLVLSPRAVARLESAPQLRPLPKIFRLVKGGKLQRDIFEGNVINTVSMMCVEDYLDALRWADRNGGLKYLLDRSAKNLATMEEFVSSHDWIDFLAKEPATRSSTSMCFVINDLTPEQVKEMTKLLASEKVAYDINSYRSAPAGIRIWGGATVEPEDTARLCPWLAWAHDQIKAK